jgi:hypothetical protein
MDTGSHGEAHVFGLFPVIRGLANPSALVAANEIIFATSSLAANSLCNCAMASRNRIFLRSSV